GKTTFEIFQKDLLSVYNQRLTKIRPIIGANGAGKTTLLKFKIKEITEEITPDSNFYLFFDFKFVTDNLDEFWPIFMQNLISQLIDEEQQFLVNLLNKLDSDKREIELMKNFKNPDLVNNTLKLISSSSNERRSAWNFFYNMQLDTKTISDFFYGIIKLFLGLDYLVVIVFDELQFLDEIDSSTRLLKLFAEKFIRFLMEQFSNKRLYIAISCLENPDIKEWTNLKKHSRNFESIVKSKEIYLGNLETGEKNEIINQVAEKIGFDTKNSKIFFTKMKESLYYFLPRDLLKHIANVIDSMDFVGYTKYEIRSIYEDSAREFMKEKLRKKGFRHLDSKVKKVGGYNIDIYATGSTRRSGYVPKAFGEATITNRSRMKQKVEKFSDWLYRMRGREYNPEKGDFAFFVCSPNTITEQTSELLNDNNIELFYFNSPIVQQIQHQMKEIDIEPISETPEIHREIEVKEKEETEELIILKESKYKLEDVPGIGSKFAEKLREAHIITIKDLMSCNVKMKAKEISGIGEVRLNKWKQNAKQILS
ncbi:MAG: helix-hairpin-helix domain-containing protein, partial [Candidatus Thorarchaeota archaeon]